MNNDRFRAKLSAPTEPSSALDTLAAIGRRSLQSVTGVVQAVGRGGAGRRWRPGEYDNAPIDAPPRSPTGLCGLLTTSSRPGLRSSPGLGPDKKGRPARSLLPGPPAFDARQTPATVVARRNAVNEDASHRPVSPGGSDQSKSSPLVIRCAAGSRRHAHPILTDATGPASARPTCSHPRFSPRRRRATASSCETPYTTRQTHSAGRP